MSLCLMQWEWIADHPVNRVSCEKEPRERTRFLTQDERRRFLKACKKSQNPYLFTFVVLLLSTGCRYNEARCLKWTDVDLFKGRITITKSKNSDMRSIPVRGLALELLQSLSAKSTSIGYVFPNKDRTKPLDLRRAFRTAIRASNLESFRGHDCRHSYATEMLAQGLSLGEIGILLGHRSVQVTKKYCHLIESRSIDAVAKMTEEIFKEEKSG